MTQDDEEYGDRPETLDVVAMSHGGPSVGPAR
jgi:hypothetical protein